jgi:hypothetical protein
VDLVKKRNAGRPGQVVRHAEKVKTKYNNQCALSKTPFDLHHHHLDGVDFYEATVLDWNHNGICLCGTIHRDYHHHFLKNHSIIAKEYYKTSFSFNPLVLRSEDEDNEVNPFLDGAEVSRYTFLEYLQFLIKDIRTQGSYVTQLNQQIEQTEQNKVSIESLSKSKEKTLGKIDLDTLEQVKQAYIKEYKSSNWALANDKTIPFANDIDLWTKVEGSHFITPL